MRVKQNDYGKKWIGRSYPTIIGRLRYWYYKKRGWLIGGGYTYAKKPADQVAREILRDFKGRGGKLK